MERTVSKSKLKTHALEYFREVQRTGQELSLDLDTVRSMTSLQQIA